MKPPRLASTTFLLAAGIILLLLSGSESAPAQVLFDDGPGNPGATGLAAIATSSGSFQAVGDYFYPTVDGTITTVTFDGAYSSSPTAQPTDDFSIYLYEDTPGAPSGPLAGSADSFSSVTSSVIATALGGYPIYQYTGTLETPVTMTTGVGSFFSIALADTTSPSSRFAWVTSTEPSTTGAFVVPKGGGIAYNGGIPNGFAFKLSGTITSPPPVAPSPVVASTGTPTTVSANGDPNYADIDSVQSNGGYGTTISLVGGSNTTGTDQVVTLGSSNAGANFTSLASDVMSVSGNDGSIFTVQLSFDITAASQLGGATEMSVLWYDPTKSLWENAVLGDHGVNDASGAELDFQGSFTSFQNKYGDDLSAYLGAYGVDPTTDTAWAVIDHNSEFGVGNILETPNVVETPEPATLAMLGVGVIGLLGFRRIRKRA